VNFEVRCLYLFCYVFERCCVGWCVDFVRDAVGGWVVVEVG